MTEKVYQNMDFDIEKEQKGMLSSDENEWDNLFKRCQSCTSCPLCKTRTNVVFGCGNKNSDIMFIGEAPGEQEDLQGIPFVGPAGKLLDKYLTAVGLSREDVYIANILKCRPPKNRDPLPEEEDVCINHLRSQLSLIKPKIIVCLGRIAAKRLIKEDFKITAEHGMWFKKGAYDICAVYHPSALLRDLSKREDMLKDMLSVARTLTAINSQN